MQKLIETLGMGDGNGSTSSTRVVMVLIALAVILPKIVASFKTGAPPVWSEGDWAMLGIAFGGKLMQNSQEAKTTEPTKTP